MMAVADPGIPADTRAQLVALQQEVDGAASYALQVASAKELFPQHNRSDRSPFREVRTVLRGMCHGVERCMYCEDAPADEVEHIRPKDLYPEVVFAWENFLFACGRCNGPKNNQFKVFQSATGAQSIDVTRPRGAVVVPPQKGDPLLIDPRRDDPFAFLLLDLKTCLFVPMPNLSSRDGERAIYTRDVLGLNRRDVLVRTRRSALGHYRDHLRCYVLDRDRGASPALLQAKATALREMSHATVWAEMKRQRSHDAQLTKLFADAPEALAW